MYMYMYIYFTFIATASFASCKSKSRYIISLYGVQSEDIRLIDILGGLSQNDLFMSYSLEILSIIVSFQCQTRRF